MKRGSELKRIAPLKPISERRARLNRKRAKAMKEVRRRDKYCQLRAIIGTPCWGELHGHEALTRARSTDIENCVTTVRRIVLACDSHHDWVHANPIKAYELGLLWPNEDRFVPYNRSRRSSSPPSSSVASPHGNQGRQAMPPTVGLSSLPLGPPRVSDVVGPTSGLAGGWGITQREESVVKATLVKDISGKFTGTAKLWRLSESYQPHDWETSPRGAAVDHVVTSATDDPFLGGVETYVFPADAEGRVVDWGELPGSFNDDMDHDRAIQGFCESRERGSVVTTSKRHFGLAVATLGLLAALVVGLVTWLNVAFYAGFVPSAHASAGDQWCGCIDFGGAIVLGGFALVGLGALVVWALTQVGS